MKKRIALSLILALTLVIPPLRAQAAEARTVLDLSYDGGVHHYDARAITLVVNGDELGALAIPPVIIDGATYVPVRAVFERMGAVVDWNGAARQILLGFHDDLVVLRLDESSINKNGVVFPIPNPARLVNGNAMLPVRAVSEALGFYVGWDADTATVTIIDTGAVSPGIPKNPAGAPEPTAPASPSNEAPSPQASAKDISASEIPEEKHPKTEITDIEVSADYFIIRSSSPISRVTKNLLSDNRLFLDIGGAEIKLPEEKTSIEIKDSKFLSKIRAAQNQTDPEMITRVVFEITAPVSYSVALSADRTSIIVGFARTTVYDVRFGQDAENDYLYIFSDQRPTLDIFTLANPSRVVIDFLLGEIGSLADTAVSGSFLSGYRFGQFTPETGRLVADLKALSSVDSIYDEQSGMTTVIFHKPTYLNISYDYALSRIVIPKPQGRPLDASAVRARDDYNNRSYTVILPGDYSGHLGFGKYSVNDAKVHSFTISTPASGLTEIAISETAIFAYTVTEDSQNVYITPKHPKEVYSKIVVIDPGHGLFDPGSSGNGLVEKDLNLDIALRVLAVAETQYPGIKFYSTRTSDTFLELEERAEYANEIADLFVSIHNNAFNEKSTGTETFYYPHDNDGAFNISSEKIAGIFLENIVKDLGQVSRKVQKVKYVVLNKTKIPATLIEIAFLTNKEDAAKLADPNFRQRAAETVAKSIAQVFEIYNTKR